MQLLYYLLLFVLALSALIAILIATGVLNVSIYNTSNPDELQDEIRELLEEENEEEEQEHKQKKE
ncbi:MAG: hypothetical protein SH857_16135 [Chitinophagales bacterium]|nr:hypothetical protein [Chitinophagales bacterium]